MASIDDVNAILEKQFPNNESERPWSIDQFGIASSALETTLHLLVDTYGQRGKVVSGSDGSTVALEIEAEGFVTPPRLTFDGANDPVIVTFSNKIEHIALANLREEIVLDYVVEFLDWYYAIA